jgi:ribokinase
VNQDIVLSVPSIPRAGETLLATSSRFATGGKGANQAVASARAGAMTEFVGAFGADSASAGLRETLEREGVRVIAFPHSAKPSGRAIVMVDEDGDNAIVVDQGVNADLPADFVEQHIERMSPADVLIVQCELARNTIEAALAAGRRSGATVILNLAPYRQLGEASLADATVIVVNESEAAGLASAALPLKDPAAVALFIARAHACTCIVTLGSRGSVVADGGRVTEIPALAVSRVVDTTGAGDAFVGVLGAKLAEGLDLIAAARVATAAAAHTVRALGAQTFPTAEELAAARHETHQQVEAEV